MHIWSKLFSYESWTCFLIKDFIRMEEKEKAIQEAKVFIVYLRRLYYQYHAVIIRYAIQNK